MGTNPEVDHHMGERGRNDQGRYTEEYDTEDFLSAVQEHEPATTSEVADAVGCVRQNADYRLRRLKDEGLVESKKVGPSLVWTIRTATCERCGEEVPRADIKTTVLGGAMDPVGWDEETPETDATVHKLCADCYEAWGEWLQDTTGSFNSFLESADR